jgi:hypothetical protein
VVTADRKVLERALIHHDSGIAFRFSAKELSSPVFLGQQYRLSEILGAVLRAVDKHADLLRASVATADLVTGLRSTTDKDEIKSVAGLEGDELVCVLEEVSGFAGKAQPGSAMFRFGEHFGFLKGVIQALEIRLVLVRPQVWQRGFGLGTASACASKTIWKNKLKAEAQRRFPHLNVTLKTADALLILEHSISAAGV